jgi:hypothetical protein
MVDLHDVEAVIVGEPLDPLYISRIGAVLIGKMLKADVMQALPTQMREPEWLRQILAATEVDRDF